MPSALPYASCRGERTAAAAAQLLVEKLGLKACGVLLGPPCRLPRDPRRTAPLQPPLLAQEPAKERPGAPPGTCAAHLGRTWGPGPVSTGEHRGAPASRARGRKGWERGRSGTLAPDCRPCSPLRWDCADGPLGPLPSYASLLTTRTLGTVRGRRGWKQGTCSVWPRGHTGATESPAPGTALRWGLTGPPAQRC